MTHEPDLLTTAREAALAILKEHAGKVPPGKAPFMDLLTIAYMRGFTQAHTETIASLKRGQT